MKGRKQRPVRRQRKVSWNETYIRNIQQALFGNGQVPLRKKIPLFVQLGIILDGNSEVSFRALSYYLPKLERREGGEEEKGGRGGRTGREFKGRGERQGEGKKSKERRKHARLLRTPKKQP